MRGNAVGYIQQIIASISPVSGENSSNMMQNYNMQRDLRRDYSPSTSGIV